MALDIYEETEIFLNNEKWEEFLNFARQADENYLRLLIASYKEEFEEADRLDLLLMLDKFSLEKGLQSVIGVDITSPQIIIRVYATLGFKQAA